MNNMQSVGDIMKRKEKDTFKAYIRQSNLIEGVDDKNEDGQSLAAFLWLTRHKELDLSVVLGLHERVMYNHLPHDRGQIRKVGVQVGGRICPAPALVPSKLAEWLDAMGHPENIDPRAAHVWFEKIHPFIDGNGRTGRMLMWWHEMKLGKFPTPIMFKDRWNYYKWFEGEK